MTRFNLEALRQAGLGDEAIDAYIRDATAAFYDYGLLPGDPGGVRPPVIDGPRPPSPVLFGPPPPLLGTGLPIIDGPKPYEPVRTQTAEEIQAYNTALFGPRPGAVFGPPPLLGTGLPIVDGPKPPSDGFAGPNYTRLFSALGLPPNQDYEPLQGPLGARRTFANVLSDIFPVRDPGFGGYGPSGMPPRDPGFGGYGPSGMPPAPNSRGAGLFSFGSNPAAQESLGNIQSGSGFEAPDLIGSMGGLSSSQGSGLSDLDISSPSSYAGGQGYSGFGSLGSDTGTVPGFSTFGSKAQGREGYQQYLLDRANRQASNKVSNFMDFVSEAEKKAFGGDSNGMQNLGNFGFGGGGGFGFAQGGVVPRMNQGIGSIFGRR